MSELSGLAGSEGYGISDDANRCGTVFPWRPFAYFPDEGKVCRRRHQRLTPASGTTPAAPPSPAPPPCTHPGTPARLCRTSTAPPPATSTSGSSCPAPAPPPARARTQRRSLLLFLVHVDDQEDGVRDHVPRRLSLPLGLKRIVQELLMIMIFALSFIVLPPFCHSLNLGRAAFHRLHLKTRQIGGSLSSHLLNSAMYCRR